MRVLLVDDDPEILELVGSFLEMKGHQVDTAESGREGLALFREHRHPLVISDYMLPDINGLDTSREILKIDDDSIIILITGHGSIESAVNAIKAGVFDYLLKPFDLSQIEVAIHKADKERELRHENRRLREAISEETRSETLIGRSRCMAELKALIRRISGTNSTVLITGESGTGKELVARAIHSASTRKDEAFVAINCGAIPENLLEDELFGHVKGAFTDAVSERMGRFEQAQGGTIFLDEIGNMSLTLQAKLLRVLQERVVTPLGSETPRSVDVRVVTATHENLKEEIREGRFREDLFYRLNVLPIRIPPLRERKEDIPDLIDFFNYRFSQLMGFPRVSFEPAAMKAIFNYYWPGNVRQLENFIERMMVLQPENHVIRFEDLPVDIRRGLADDDSGFQFQGGTTNLKEKTEELERTYIIEAMKLSGGIKSEAAKRLGLKRTTLIQKMKKLAIDFVAGEDN